eukprot:CAMPEP_0194269126 /NCGR_PEP_ID=MMETSP0169-20130528/3337_1 /TAXON_ID=218684 /ORGANISM="Corethron pennatum, Strain L29A3" /LENGTH=154 /DNA_ID=CAMNT_0039010651 /DNA_START=84 /DNA_END=548 /DNA_ORIENTATION=-
MNDDKAACAPQRNKQCFIPRMPSRRATLPHLDPIPLNRVPTPQAFNLNYSSIQSTNTSTRRRSYAKKMPFIQSGAELENNNFEESRGDSISYFVPDDVSKPKNVGLPPRPSGKRGIMNGIMKKGKSLPSFFPRSSSGKISEISGLSKDAIFEDH